MKIQDYNPFLGILELLAILFPGAIITMFCLYSVGSQDQEIFNVGKESNAFLFGFLFLILSYFFGQVVFQLGSYVDDIYDKIKGYLFDQTELKKVNIFRGITKDGPKPALNTFEWSLMTLQNKENQKPYTEVVKMKADSKFFRANFIIANFGVIYCLLFQSFDMSTFIALVFIIAASFAFYIKIRQKCSKTMYKHILFYIETDNLKK